MSTGRPGKRVGIIRREKMVRRGQGGSKTRRTWHREAVLDGEQMRGAAFKTKPSVNSVNALKRGGRQWRVGVSSLSWIRKLERQERVRGKEEQNFRQDRN